MSVFSEDIGRRRSLYRLAVARSDISQASALAAYAEEHVPGVNDLWIPLQEAVIIAYARPFTANRPFGALPARWSKFDDPRSQKVHDEILRMRDEVVAHSDASQRAVVIFPPGARAPVAGVRPSEQATLAVIFGRPDPSFFGSIRRLCEGDLLPRLHTAAHRELQALFGQVPPLQPFDLLTGEPTAVQMDGIVISEREAPKLAD